MLRDEHRLEGHKLFATRDLDEARDEVARVYCPHRLEVQGRRALDAVHNRVDFKEFSLNYMHYGAEVDIDPGQLERFFLLQIPLSGSATVRCGSQSVDAGIACGTLLSPSRRISMRWSADCRKLLVQIGRARMEGILEGMLDRPIGRPLEFDAALSFERPAMASLRRLAMLLCEDCEGGGSLGEGIAGARMVEILAGALIEGQPHSYSGSLGGRTPSIAPAHVRRAERFMHEHVASDIGLAEIAVASGVSARALQDGFRRFRDTSPLEALRAIRMDRARAELLEGGDGLSVTTIALKWGFTHLSRFSGAYRRRFGETPSQTLRLEDPGAHS